MLSVNISKQAQKTLLHVHPKHAKQLAAKITSLRSNPYPHDSKKLRGSTLLRTDCGEYRIIYESDDTQLDVLLIGKRNDSEVYRKLKRIDR